MHTINLKFGGGGVQVYSRRSLITTLDLGDLLHVLSCTDIESIKLLIDKVIKVKIIEQQYEIDKIFNQLDSACKAKESTNNCWLSKLLGN